MGLIYNALKLEWVMNCISHQNRLLEPTKRRGNFANRPMTASTLGGIDDDTISLGTNQTDQLSYTSSIEKNYCRIIKLLIHNGIPKYEIKCPFVLPGKRYSIHATLKRSKLFPKLTTEKEQ